MADTKVTIKQTAAWETEVDYCGKKFTVTVEVDPEYGGLVATGFHTTINLEGLLHWSVEERLAREAYKAIKREVNG